MDCLKQKREFTEEHKKKISTSLLKIGESHHMKTQEARLKVGQRNKLNGIRPPSNEGKHFTKEHKEKIGLANSKEKSHLWKGGNTYQEYSLEWTASLRRLIRKRDNFTCQLCGTKQDGRSLDVHHIDYIKSNCSPDNLVSLCIPCHRKTNINREKWMSIFDGRKVWQS